MTTDPLEQHLRDHLHRAADTITEPIDLSGQLDLVRRDAARTSDARRRRIGTASVASVAAVAVVVGLVLAAQGPQPVSSTGDAADAPGVAGVATGSSTGSATGALKGWSGTYSDDPADVVDVPRLRPTLTGTEDAQVTSLDFSTLGPGADGQAAAPIAVLADLRVGAPLRFVTASVQPVDQLGPGKGVERTIDGRPARIVVDNYGWQRLVWDLDGEHRVLVQSHGLDPSQLEDALASLRPDGADGWTMEPGDTGLGLVATPAPSEQRSLTLGWQTGDVSSPQPTGSTTSFQVVTGGEYEFWAALGSWTPWRGGDPQVVDVEVDGAVVPGVLLRGGSYEDGANHSELSALTPTGAVVRLSRYDTRAVDGDPDSARTALAAATRFVAVDDAAWSDLLGRAASAARQRAAADGALRQKLAEDGGCLEEGAPACADLPVSTLAPTTTAPARETTTTSAPPPAAPVTSGAG